MIGSPRTEQVLLELRDAADATQRSFGRLIDFPELIAGLTDVADDDKELAAQYVTLARQNLSQAMDQLNAAYRKLGGYRPDDSQ